MTKTNALLLAILLCMCGRLSAQEITAQTDSVCPDSALVNETLPSTAKESLHPFHARQLILPAALIGAGLAGLSIHQLNKWDHQIQGSLAGNRPIHVDNYLQYTPMVAVYGLNLCGLKGAHKFRDRTLILATSYLIMGALVNTLKYSTRIRRPDGSSNNSFPSGHTATAFMGAEFLRMEYRDTSPWIGAAGYLVAAGTGFLRLYNDKHYLTDVLAGAGIGVLSTRAAYWIYPSMERWLFGHRRHTCSVMTLPSYDYYCGTLGVTCTVRF